MAHWGVCSDSQIIAQSRYDSTHTRSFSLKLNTRTDKDIIQWLSKHKSMQGAIKQLIRDEIARSENDNFNEL